MIDVTVKTLDSQNHFFSVEDHVSVRQFKEHISPTLSIPVDQQRVIFRGQVLQNDRRLSEYNVANNTVHVVQSGGNRNDSANHAPPPARPPQDSEDEDGEDESEGGIFIAVHSGAAVTREPRDEGPQDRASGAQRRLMAGDQMLTRASILLDHLEAFSNMASSSRSAPNDRFSPGTNRSPMETCEHNGSQGRARNPLLSTLTAPFRRSSQAPQHSSAGRPSPASSQRAYPSRQPESHRIRDFGLALQDYLAIQERLTPYLRFIQDALQQNRLYTFEGESSSTQYVFDIVSSILHLLGHSLHAFSDIVTNFNLPPDNRTLGASSAVLVEQAAIVRASIAFPSNLNPLAMLALLGGSQGQNTALQQSATQSQPTSRNSNYNQAIRPPVPFPAMPTGGSGTSAPVPRTEQISTAQASGPNLYLRQFVEQQLARTFNNGAALSPQNSERQQSTGNVSSRLAQEGPESRSAANDERPRDNRGNATTTGGNSSANAEGISLADFLGMGPAAGQSHHFDQLLPCHTHHDSHEGEIRTPRLRNLPIELRRIVHAESSVAMRNSGIGVGTTVEILIDLIRNSRMIDLLLPVLKDVILHYLMRGSDPTNLVNIETCARKLARQFLPFVEQFFEWLGRANESVNIQATCSGILTGFLTSVIQSVLQLYPGDEGQLSIEIGNSLSKLQIQLIQTFKLCYPDLPNVGFISVDYLVEHFLGGMSVIFKNEVRRKLIDHVKTLEARLALDPTTSLSFVVYKEPSANVPSTQLFSSTASAFTSAAASSSETSNVIRASAQWPHVRIINPAPSTPNNPISNDVRSDEALQVRPDPTQQQGNSSRTPSSRPLASRTPASRRRSSSRRCLCSEGTAVQGSVQIVSAESLIQSLPSEWADTIEHDIRRQQCMLSQPEVEFSSGYQSLFSLKE